MTQPTDCHNMSRTLISLLTFTLLCAFAGAVWAEPHTPATSPGLQVGITAFDLQHNAAIGRQIARNPGANTVHFCWTMWDHIPTSVEDADRFVQYNSYDIAAGALNQGETGIGVSLGDLARAGFCRLDIDSDNLAHMVLHQREYPDALYSTYHLHFPVEGGTQHLDTLLPKPSFYPEETETMWADVAVEQNYGAKDASTDIWHVIGLGMIDVGGGFVITTDRLWYWRYDAGAATPVWQGPVLIDSTRHLSYTIDADDNSDNVCLVYTSDWSTDGLGGMNNVAYRETITSGLGWITPVELGEINKNFATAYCVPGGPQAWIETSVLYDHAGDLHILYTERRESGSDHIALKHWRKSRYAGPVPVVYAWYDTGGDETPYDRATWGRTLNIGFISLSVGDGSTLCDGGGEDNTDYLYTIYGKLCGETPEEQADTSALGFCNAELYLTVSRDHGDFWSNPINLTNTKTPGCNPVDPEIPGPGDCASEAWASLARTVDDLHILYIADRQPDAYDKSGWTINPVNYLRLPGGTTDDPYLCATLPPSYAATLDSNAGPCGLYELNAGDRDSTILRLYNIGPGPMTGTISPLYVDPPGPLNWLLFDGFGTADFAVPSADSTTAFVTLSAASLAPGLYEGQVLVAHSDHLQTSPDTFDIALAVDWCPCLADPECDGVVDILDVVKTVNVAFRSAPPEYDAFCAFARTDVDCDGVTNILDVVRIVKVAFRYYNPATQFCAPCAP